MAHSNRRIVSHRDFLLKAFQSAICPFFLFYLTLRYFCFKFCLNNNNQSLYSKNLKTYF